MGSRTDVNVPEGRSNQSAIFYFKRSKVPPNINVINLQIKIKNVIKRKKT